MHEQRECSQCRGRGTSDSGRTCVSCGGRGWKIEYISETDYSSGPEPLFFKSLLCTGITLGFIMGGYFGWWKGGIGGALTYGAIGAVVLGFCAGLFSTFLRMLIKIGICIGIIIALKFLWGKGNPNSYDLRTNNTESSQR